MGFSFINSKGKKYYLHKKNQLYFFSKKKEESIELPAGFKIVENIKTGLPMVKKKL